MMQYLPTISPFYWMGLLVTCILIWSVKKLVYIVSIHSRGLKSFYQIPGYSFIDWEALTWPAQRLITGLHLKRRSELGPIYAIIMRLFQPNAIVISDPSMVESLYKIDGNLPVRMRAGTNVFDILSRFSNRPKGLLLSEGAEWSRKRKSISRSILNPSIVNQFIPELNDIGSCLTDRISDSIDESKIISSLQFLIRCATVEGAGSFVYNRNLGYLAKDLTPKAKRVFESGFSLFKTLNLASGYSFIESLLKSRKLYEKITPFRTQYRNEFDESIRIRLADSGDFESDRFDFISNMLSDKSLTRDELSVLSNGLLVAGIDTTATTILMALYHLGLNLDKQKKLREEIERVVGDRESLTRQDLEDLKYLKLCVKEGQRLHPAVFMVARFSKEDLILNGYHIPKSTQFFVNNYVIGRQADLFSSPAEYRPERWEEPALQNPYYFLPFGYGPRICVGKMFAELEIYIYLTKIIRRFEVETVHNFKVCGYVFLETDREMIFKFVPVD